jgi:hypothetical protein
MSTFANRWLRDSTTYPVMVCVVGGLGLVSWFGGRRLFVAPETQWNRAARGDFDLQQQNYARDSAKFREVNTMFIPVATKYNMLTPIHVGEMPQRTSCILPETPVDEDAEAEEE